jgi:hypothetical protein
VGGVGGASSGGYHLSLRVEDGEDAFVIWKDPSLTSPGSSDVILFQHAAADFVSTGNWYTLVFTLQTDAAGDAVTLSGKVFPQGEPGGTPLAQFSGVDSTAPVTAPGQTGFRLLDTTGSGADVDLDNFTADASLTVNVGETVALGAANYLTSLNVNGTATLAPGGNRFVVTRGLFVAGRLDLSDNDMIIRSATVGSWSGTAYSGVAGFLQSGHSGGSWTGSGIVTSTSDAAGGLTSLGVASAGDVLDLGAGETAIWNGETVGAGDVIVKFTYGGDANLDGIISSDDYAAIDFNVAVAGASGWSNGDFNYDGVISGDDYSVIDFNIVAQGPPVSAPLEAEMSEEAQEFTASKGDRSPTFSHGAVVFNDAAEEGLARIADDVLA